jgi:predicted O-methyltransferase YrrM
LLPGRELADRYEDYNCYAPESERDKTGAFVYQLGDEFPQADIYVLQQRPERFWLSMIPHLQARGRVVVAETDDFYGGLPHNHPFWSGVQEQFGLASRAEVQRRIIDPVHEIYRLCDAMTVSTPFLARAYEHLNPNIHVLPNCLDKEMWQELPKRDWDRVRIGWMGEARMRPDDMQVLKGLIGPFLRRHPEVDFVAAGDPHVHDILDVPHGQRVTYGRVLFPDIASITATMDVGLVPLASSDFNEAKSCLKGMEYAAAGIPCVASPSESYRQWVEPGVNGFLARRPKDWLRHLEALVTDDALRKRMGNAARKKVEQHWIQDNAHQWHDVYEQLGGNRFQRAARTAISRQALQKPNELAPFLERVGTPSTVVEIGTAQGGTFGALCEIAADDALIVSIDLPGGDLDETSEDDKYGKRDQDRIRSYAKPGQTVELLQADSHAEATRDELERILAGRAIELLFLDGDHSYDGVQQDFDMYVPLLAPEGLVAFHDILTHTGILENEYKIEVDRFWNEIKGSYDWEEFTDPTVDWGWGKWGGIGLIRMEAQRVAA